MTMTSGQAVDILRAAGEPTRLRILALLASEELSVLELCRILDQSQPPVSRHLKLLETAGLIEQSRAAQARPRRLKPDGFYAARDRTDPGIRAARFVECPTGT